MHLDLKERHKIARWPEAKAPTTEIAVRLGRHRSTIFRELKRNRFVDDERQHLSGYDAVNAYAMTAERRANRRKLIQHAELRSTVVDCPKAGWTPEQIAGRLRADRSAVRVSHETIYQYVYLPTAMPSHSGDICLIIVASVADAVGDVRSRRDLNWQSAIVLALSHQRRNSAIGKVISSSSARSVARPTSPRWSNA